MKSFLYREVAAGGCGPSRAPRGEQEELFKRVVVCGPAKTARWGRALHHAGVRQGDFYYRLALTHVALTTCWPPSSLWRPTLSTTARCQLEASHSRRVLSTSPSVDAANCKFLCSNSATPSVRPSSGVGSSPTSSEKLAQSPPLFGLTWGILLPRLPSTSGRSP